MNTIIKQARRKTRDGNEVLVTTVRMGPHVLQAIEYSSNQGYYVKVNGKDVKLA